MKLKIKIKKKTSENIEMLFAVENTDINIEEKVRKRLFKSFNQVDFNTVKRFNETELKLMICKNVNF